MKIARLSMDPQDKTRFEIHGKSSVKYHLKANHVVEAKRWFWTLNNAIQWAKDEAKEEERRQTKDAEVLRQAKIDHIEGRASENLPDVQPLTHAKSISNRNLAPSPLATTERTEKAGSNTTRPSTQPSQSTVESAPDNNNGSVNGRQTSIGQDEEVSKVVSQGTIGPDIEADDDEYAEYASSNDLQPADKDALNIAAQSAKLQLDLLANVSSSLQREKSKNPNILVADPAVDRALATYEEAVGSLQGLVQNLLQISRDRDDYWNARLNKEAYLRKMWEESMARVAQEHEELQSRMGESEEKRRRTKRALRQALENPSTGPSRPLSFYADEGDNAPQGPEVKVESADTDKAAEEQQASGEGASQAANGKKSAISQLGNIDDLESDEDEFFDAIDSGEVEVEDRTAAAEVRREEVPKEEAGSQLRVVKRSEVEPSFKGYEDPVRKKLNMDYDNRPKLSLWVSLLYFLLNCWGYLPLFPHASMRLTKSRVFSNL